MIIYLDYLFIENVIFDFIILKEVASISKVKHKNKSIIFATMFSAIYVVIMLIFKLKGLNYFVSKLLLAFLTVYIAFKPKKLICYTKLVSMFFLVSIVNVGILIVSKNLLGINELTGITKISIYIFVYIVGRIILFKLWKIYSTNITKSSLNYTVTLQIGKKEYKYEAFLDTGNTVYSHGMPVIFAEVLDESILEELHDKEYFETKTVTIGNITKRKAYVFEDILISNNEGTYHVKAGVVFENNKMSKFNNYNMILNYILYTESMGGIKIWRKIK